MIFQDKVKLSQVNNCKIYNKYNDTDFGDNDDNDAYWRSNAIKWFMIGLLSKDKANKDNHKQQRIPCDGDDYDECEYEEDDDNEYS